MSALSKLLRACAWPQYTEFQFLEERGIAHVVMPGGAMLPLNHHDLNGVDRARAHFIVEACNEKLRTLAKDAR